MVELPSCASAPGKMMLSGEYAVLDGAPAVVCAVQRRALVRWVPAGSEREVARGLDHPHPNFPEVAAVAALGGLEGDLVVDVSALRGPQVKLGLGSSAAAAAAAAALVSARATQEQDVFALAFRGHAEVAPQGSGADVAAAAHGGTLLYEAKSRSVLPIPWPPGLRAAVVFTGQAASTRELVGRVRELEGRNRLRYASCMTRLSSAALSLAQAFQTRNVPRIIVETADYHDAMRDLGQAARAPIVEERLAELARLARECGGAAKPSGAGGGDVAIGFFPDPEAHQRYERACADAGFEVLDIDLGGPGPLIE